jgi:hypothetical protein
MMLDRSANTNPVHPGQSRAIGFDALAVWATIVPPLNHAPIELKTHKRVI